MTDSLSPPGPSAAPDASFARLVLDAEDAAAVPRLRGVPTIDSPRDPISGSGSAQFSASGCGALFAALNAGSPGRSGRRVVVDPA